MPKTLFEHLIPETTPESQRVWENPDPRIKWALDILEPKPLYEPMWYRILPTTFATGMCLAAWHVGNKMNKFPKNAGIVIGAFWGIFGYFAGEKIYQTQKSMQADELAMVKHYIMLHPEKFPEPEPMKIGDKRVFYAWTTNRWNS